MKLIIEETSPIYKHWEEILDREGLSLNQLNSKLLSQQKNYIGCLDDFHELELHKRIDIGLLPRNELRGHRLHYSGLRNGLGYNSEDLEPLCTKKKERVLAQTNDPEYARHVQEGLLHIGLGHLENKVR